MNTCNSQNLSQYITWSTSITIATSIITTANTTSRLKLHYKQDFSDSNNHNTCRSMKDYTLYHG